MIRSASLRPSAFRRADSELRSTAARGLVFVCTNGVLVPSRASKAFAPSADWSDYRNHPVTSQDGLLLPTCRRSDVLVGQPPLVLTLDQETMAALLRAERQGILAASILGPPQEKTCNEDFALAGVILDKENNCHAFTAVADGVTTKTFWPERASRLACFVALLVAIDYVEAGADYSISDVHIVRHALGKQLQRWLELDRQWITEQAAVPSEWDPASFNKFSSNNAFWYNTTLLISLVSSKGGILLWAGDGAIHIRKNFGRERVETSSPLLSSDDTTVSNVVSLAGPILFAGGRVETEGTLESLRITLCTDGPDRTLQRNGDVRNFYDVSDSSSIAAALDKLTRLPNSEIDNYSAAITRWPMPPPAPIQREDVDLFLRQPRDPNPALSPTAAPRTLSSGMHASSPLPNVPPANAPQGHDSFGNAIATSFAPVDFRKVSK